METFEFQKQQQQYKHQQEEEEIIFEEDILENEQEEPNINSLNRSSPSISEFKKKLNLQLSTGLMIPNLPYSSPKKMTSSVGSNSSSTNSSNSNSTNSSTNTTPPVSPSPKSPIYSPNTSMSNLNNINPENSPRLLKKSASEKFHVRLFKTKQKKDKNNKQQQDETNNTTSPITSPVTSPMKPTKPAPSPIQSSSKSFSVPKLPISPLQSLNNSMNSNNNGNVNNNNNNGKIVPELSLNRLHNSLDNNILSSPNYNNNGDSNESTAHSMSDGNLTPESDLKLSEVASRPPYTPRLTHESKSLPFEITLKIIYFTNNNNNNNNNNQRGSNNLIEKIMKFSPCSTIDESLSIIIPNLMFHKGLQSARQTVNNEWETDAIGADLDKNHHSFSLFKPINDDNYAIDNNYPLHKECTLIELGLKEMDSLVLKTVSLQITFVKITIPNFSDSQLSAQATLKLNQFTSVRSIIRKLYLKFHKSIDVSSHGIYLSDPTQNYQEVLLEEDELFSSYNINSSSQLIFKREEITSESSTPPLTSLVSSQDFGQNSSKSLKLKILISTLFSRYNYLTLNFDPSCTVSKAIKITGLRTGLLDSLNKCGFYLTPSEDDDDGFWMDEELSLDSYHLKNFTLLEFKERCRKYIVNIKSRESYCTFKFDQFVKVSTLFNIIISNENILDPKNYYLTIKDGSSLESERYLWSYDIKSEIEFRELPNKVLLFGQNGETNLVYVDFNDPVQDVVNRLSMNLGYLNNPNHNNIVNNNNGNPSPLSGSSGMLPTTRERSYTIKRLGHLVNNIDVRRSLKSQGVQPNDPLILEEIKPLPNNVDQENNENEQQQPEQLQESNGEELQVEKQINIWNEPVDSRENIIYSTNQKDPHHPIAIEAGTLNKLIIRLTSENTHDLMFMKTLLMTYLSYTSSVILLKKLFERFQIPQDLEIDEKEKLSIQLRVGNVIKYWVEHHYEDFDHDSTKLMVDFVDSHMMSAFPSLGHQIRSYILKRTCGIKSDSSKRTSPSSQLASSLPMSFTNNGSSSLSDSVKKSTSNSFNGSISSSSSTSSSNLLPSPRSMTTNSSLSSSQMKLVQQQKEKDKFPETKTKGLLNPRSLFDFDDEEIARQLTLYEFSLYSSIKPTEFLNQAWNKPAIAARKSPTILQMINRFNDVGLWVVKLILEPERVKTRAKRMERIIKIAEKLRDLKNFNTLMSFIGGLNNSAILRLKYTKALVSKKYLDILEGLEKEMSCEGSYKNYRVLLHNTDPPCVPYIVVYLADLTFMEDGNPNIIGNNLINFSKYTLIYKVISEVQQYQWSEYSLKPVPIIQTFLKDLNPPSAQDLYKISLQKEPKNAQKSEIF